MSNCAWCNKYGAINFYSLDYRKQRYREKFCSKKCFTEFQQNNNTLHLDDDEIKLESSLKFFTEYNKFIIRGRKILLKFVVSAAIVVSTLWGILTLFQTKWNSSGAPKKYAISIIFISIGIFYFYKKIKSKKNNEGL